MCDQGHNGAANMSEKFKFVQTLIRNLSVSSACEVQFIKICMGIVEKINNFFDFPKFNNVLLEAITNSSLNPLTKSLK
jgi:hypothetical protein